METAKDREPTWDELWELEELAELEAEQDLAEALWDILKVQYE